MAPLELNGENLGKKHQHYNELLKEATQNQNFQCTTNFKDDSEINILLQIDVACTNRNVEFVLEAFKCENMLFVSRAVKRSTWLITDPNYAHIINIDYLQTHLFPYMLTEAINKLKLSIRLHNKDEKRAEEFFVYEVKRNLNTALKWLPYCSLSFIEQFVAKNKRCISKNTLKRLCERSISVLEIFVKNYNSCYYGELYGTLFLINNHTEKYLELLEDLHYYILPPFGRKYTKVLMKVCPQRIIDKFDKYVDRIDLDTFARYMKKEDIKPFILNLAKNNDMQRMLYYSNVKYFLKYMPKDGRYEFVKQMFMNTENSDKLEGSVAEIGLGGVALKLSNYGKKRPQNIYNWYTFAPFDEAFHDLKKMIHAESSPDERNIMLRVLVRCAGNNVKNMYTLLKYFNEKHINEPFKFKKKFIDKVLEDLKIIKNTDIWPIINRIFHSMEVYVVSTNNVQNCIETIIIYNAIHGEPNPEIVKEKFIFNTMKSYRNKLSNDEREKVFNYLYNYMQKKINDKPIINNVCLNEVIDMMKTLFDLINDWGKNLNDFPMVLNKVKELITIKFEKYWWANMTPLYNVNKSWRKYMFEESVAMWPSETVLINALKHDPNILSRYEGETDYLRCNDTASLRVLLNKLRLYWPRSLATEWINFYLQQLDNPSNHKAAVKALMIILPQDQLKDIIKKHTPDDSKINWGATDELTLSLRKCIAKKMYLSRPLLPVQLVLQYAKGDYLQYALPSLSSVLANISRNQSGPVVQQLLSAPVSLQKHGIRLALAKLKCEELKPLFWQVWKSTTNLTIRTVLFQSTFHALCNKANTAIVEDLWELLSDFIDNLSHKENKKIYNLLGEVKKVPINIRGRFYIKSCTFLKSMPLDDFIKNIINNLINILPYLMDQVDTEFIANVILKDIHKTFVNSKYTLLDVISTNVLYCKDEVTQTQRYNRILGPLLDRYLPAWDEKHDNKKYVRFNIENLLKSLISHLTEVFLDRSKIIPVKLFTDIQNKLENSLSAKNNYVFITTWKLTTAFTTLVYTNRPSLPYIDVDESGDIDLHTSYDRAQLVKEKRAKLCAAIIPSFANVCTDNLKEDVNKYFPSIYLLYGKAINNVLNYFDQHHLHFPLYKHMLALDKSIENFLMVTTNCSTYAPEEHEASCAEIISMMQAHPSTEVQIHSAHKWRALYTLNLY